MKVGNGTVPPAIEGTNIIEVPQQMVCKTKEELDNKVYDNFEANYNNKEYLVQHAIMLSTNKTIQQCNYEMIRRIPTPEEPTVYLSRDICKDTDNQGR